MRGISGLGEEPLSSQEGLCCMKSASWFGLVWFGLVGWVGWVGWLVGWLDS